jgi:prepilin-type processing-associated H-X9-DG protein
VSSTTQHIRARRAPRPIAMAAFLVVAALAALLVPAAIAPAPRADALPYFTRYPTPTEMSGPGALTDGPDGNLWFVEGDGNRIARGTPAGEITEFLIPTADSHPHGIVTGPDGNLWFTEHTGGKIGRITTDGVITEFTIPSADSMPHSIAAGSDGNLWFTERGANKVGRITTAGVITEFPIPTAGSQPVGITVGSDGNLWFGEADAENVGRVTLNGEITEFPLPSGNAAGEMTTGADGNVWFTDGHVIGRMTPSGVFTAFPTDDANSVPNYIAKGPDGNVWYSDMGGPGYRIGRITPTGDVTAYPFENIGLPAGIDGGPDGAIYFTAWPEGAMVKMRITPDPTGEFTPLTPARILDTRTAVGGHPGVLGPAQKFDAQITGQGGVPATGVSAVVLNATVTGTTAPSYLTLWPAGVNRPVLSNLNYVPGQTVPNLVTVKVGDAGKVSVYNNAGSTHVIFDVVGYYADATGNLGSRYHPVTPTRLFDTRNGSGGVGAHPMAADGVIKFKVTGKGGVPASGVTSVVMNVTVTEPTSSGYITVYPDDVSRPTASNLNFVPGLTVPNLVEVRVPASGVVDFYNFSNFGGTTHLLADVVGFYDGDKASESGRLITGVPGRILDTRLSSPFPTKCIPANGYIYFDITPGAPLSAYVFNVTVTEPTTSGHFVVYPGLGTTPPLASNLNFVAGQTVANQVIASTAGSRINLWNSAGCTHVVVDVFAVFTNQDALPPGTPAADAGVTAQDAGSAPIDLGSLLEVGGTG